jgi:hypothetical protein
MRDRIVDARSRGAVRPHRMGVDLALGATFYASRYRAMMDCSWVSWRARPGRREKRFASTRRRDSWRRRGEHLRDTAFTPRTRCRCWRSSSKPDGSGSAWPRSSRSVRDSTGRPRSQRVARLVVGRSARRGAHGAAHRLGRLGGGSRADVLRLIGQAMDCRGAPRLLRQRGRGACSRIPRAPRLRRRRRFSSHQMPAATAPTTTSQPMAISNIIPLMPEPNHARAGAAAMPSRLFGQDMANVVACRS